MSDTRCGCTMLDRCTAQATQEDLLCDACRTRTNVVWKLLDGPRAGEHLHMAAAGFTIGSATFSTPTR